MDEKNPLPNQYTIRTIAFIVVPYYLLDKFYGNLSIIEYRTLSNTEHFLSFGLKPLDNSQDSDIPKKLETKNT
jgi:hypothetical protein